MHPSLSKEHRGQIMFILTLGEEFVSAVQCMDAV